MASAAQAETQRSSMVSSQLTATCEPKPKAYRLGLTRCRALAVRRQVHLHLLTILLLRFGHIGRAACWLARHLRNLRFGALMRIVDIIQFATCFKTYFRLLQSYCILKKCVQKRWTQALNFHKVKHSGVWRIVKIQNKF